MPRGDGLAETFGRIFAAIATDSELPANAAWLTGERAHQLKEADKRKAEEARLNHIAEMKALAKREPQVWQEVDRLLESGQKSASVYDRPLRSLKSSSSWLSFRIPVTSSRPASVH